jgi:hypothetical protein
LNFRPTFDIVAGISDQAYGCGACVPADKTSGKCAECATKDCNEVIVLGEDYLCDSFSFNADDKKFVAAKTQQTCKVLKDKKRMCNK